MRNPAETLHHNCAKVLNISEYPFLDSLAAAWNRVREGFVISSAETTRHEEAHCFTFLFSALLIDIDIRKRIRSFWTCYWCSNCRRSFDMFLLRWIGKELYWSGKEPSSFRINCHLLLRRAYFWSSYCCLSLVVSTTHDQIANVLVMLPNFVNLLLSSRAFWKVSLLL